MSKVKVRMSEQSFNDTAVEIATAGMAFDAIVVDFMCASVELYYANKGNISYIESGTKAIATFAGVGHTQAISWYEQMIPHQVSKKANWRGGENFWGKKQPSKVAKTRKWRKFLSDKPDFRDWKRAAIEKTLDATSLQKALDSVAGRLVTLTSDDGDYASLVEVSPMFKEMMAQCIKVIDDAKTKINTPAPEGEIIIDEKHLPALEAAHAEDEELAAA